MSYGRRYYWKKAYAIYPGVIRPVSAPFLSPHYALRHVARGRLRAALDAMVGLGFLAWIPFRAIAVQRRFGLSDRWRTKAIAIARARFADPNDLALFGIEEPEELDDYIRRYEDAALNKLINPRGWTDCLLADKARFAERCRDVGVRHAETVALVERGQVSLAAALDGTPLIAKPTDGEGGEGIVALGSVSEASAIARSLPRRGRFVVQRRVEAHPALAGLADFALPTVRIVTMLDEVRAPEVTSATFRCASIEGATVDNMKAGGLIVPVDLVTGTLGIARKGYGGGDYPVHPATGAIIAGRVLPDWPASMTLARHAHAAGFSDYVMVGWDVALTPQGPILIEGNGKPGVLMPQRAARRGLGEGRYGALLAYNLAHIGR